MNWYGHSLSILRNNPLAMEKARRLLYNADPSAQVSLLSDEQVLHQLSHLTALRNSMEIATLRFDGRMLRWRQEFRDRICSIGWTAVSGRSGYQSKEFQNQADKGPIPEGA